MVHSCQCCLKPKSGDLDSVNPRTRVERLRKDWHSPCHTSGELGRYAVKKLGEECPSV